MVIQSFWLDLMPAYFLLFILMVWTISEWLIDKTVKKISNCDKEAPEDDYKEPVFHVISGSSSNHKDKDWHKFIFQGQDEEAS